MIEKTIEKNIAFLQRHISCDRDTIEIYKYSLRILYSYIIDVFVLMSLAIITHKVLETIITLIVFAIFQVYGGGYHANTKLGCFIIMILGWFIGMFGLISIVSINYLISIIILTISTVLVFMFTPVLNYKHPVSKDVYLKSKRKVRVFTIFIDMLSVICVFLNNSNLVNTISLVMLLYSISLIFAMIKSKRGAYYK